MKKIYTSIICLILYSAISNAQVITFNKQYDPLYLSYPIDVFEMPDSGFMSLVVSNSNTFYFFKMNKYGDSLWIQPLLIPVGSYVFGVVKTFDNGFVISYRESINYASILKTDSLGIIQWSDSVPIAYASPGKIIENFQHEIIVTGYYDSSTVTNTTDTWLAKFDSAGNLMWTKTYTYIGDTHADFSVGLSNSIDSMILFLSYTPYDSLYDFRIYKVNQVGDTIWTSYHNADTTKGSVRDIKQSGDGSIYICGSGQYFPGNMSVDLFRLNSSGDSITYKNIFPPPAYFQSANSINIDSDGLPLLACNKRKLPFDSYNKTRMHFMKLDTLLNVIWDYTDTALQMSNTALKVFNSSDGGYMISGFTGGYGFNMEGALFYKIDGNLLASAEQISNSESEWFTVYPNPLNNNKLNILYRLPNGNTGQFKLYDITGKMIFKGDLPEGATRKSFNLPELSNGIYQCIFNSENVFLTQKIIVIK